MRAPILRLRLLLCGALVTAFGAPAAHASPIGIVYRPFLDAPVTDGLGNEAGETHRTLFGIPFDEMPDVTIQDLVLSAPPGSSFVDPPDPIYYDEQESPFAGGSLLDFWAIGDVVDPADPLFTNAVATGSASTVLFGIEGLYWVGTFASAGQSAALAGQSFELGFADGSTTSLVPLMAGVVFGAGTEDSPLVYFAEFDAGDLAGSPTSLHLELAFLHVPEPHAAWLVAAALLISSARRRMR